MKSTTLALITSLAFLAPPLTAQEAVVPAPPSDTPDASTPVEIPVTPAPEGEAAGPIVGGAPAAPAGEAQMGADGGGYRLKDANLNEVLQVLAKEAGKQYFHTPSLEGPQFKVTGHLTDEDPEASMEALAFQFGFELYRKGNTIYALSPTQVTQLPQEHFVYQLRYLRPSDIDQIKNIIQPALTPVSGVVNFETKTNTLLIIDTPKRIEVVQDLLAKLDQPKGQIIVETKILRVNSTAGSKIGVDWSASLGDGVTLSAQQSLNGLFNLPEYSISRDEATGVISGPENSIGYQYNTGSTSRRRTSTQGFSVNPLTGATTLAPETGTIARESEWTSVLNELRVQGAGLVLSPMEVSAVLRALNNGNLAKQKSNPTIITEDNETASVSIIDRVPIVTATVTQGTGTTQTTEEVRYLIDESDPANDPTRTREIGVTVSVTPTLLPDNTIRMALRPRTAQIVEFIEGAPLSEQMSRGNRYPRVAEATIETIARVPNGYSLLIGGFYNEAESDRDNKVPLLGDVPFLNFFFKSKQKEKEQTSLVFIITPTSYDPTGAVETLNVTDQLMDRLDLRADHDSINPDAPGPAHKPGLRRTMRAMLFDATGLPPREPAADELPQLEGYEALPDAQPTPPPARRQPRALRDAPLPQGMSQGEPAPPPPAPKKQGPEASPPAATPPKPTTRPPSSPLFR
jgi:type II secretory pathway component GspD/PulD (secretin)